MPWNARIVRAVYLSGPAAGGTDKLAPSEGAGRILGIRPLALQRDPEYIEGCVLEQVRTQESVSKNSIVRAILIGFWVFCVILISFAVRLMHVAKQHHHP